MRRSHIDRRGQRRGLTLVELVIVVVCVAVILAVTGLLLTARPKRNRGRSMKDAVQLGMIHQSMLVYAESNEGRLPLPGRVRRLPDPYTERSQHGLGQEDAAANTTDNLMSLLVGEEYFSTDTLCGPTEQSDLVALYVYDYESYDPAQLTFWDEGLRADIERGPCHVSYFHRALIGKTRQLTWRSTADASTAVLSTRGPRDGATSGLGYERSLTLQLHGDRREWQGNVVFADNRVEIWSSFSSPDSSDNIFAPDGAYLVMYEQTDGETVKALYDPLVGN